MLTINSAGDVERSDSEASVGGDEEEKRGVARSGGTKKQITRRKSQTTSNTRSLVWLHIFSTYLLLHYT